MPIQQMLLGVGAVATKTYVDDIFNIDAYVGDGYHQTLNTGGTTSRDIVNGIDFTEGGLAIFKQRNSPSSWQWVDTEIGTTNSLNSTNTNALDTNRPNGLKTFNNNGFTIGYDGQYNFGGSTVGWNNAVAGEYVASSFKKTKGFFDVVKFTGNATNREIAHSLGANVGMMIIKGLDSTSTWYVWHRDMGDSNTDQYNYRLRLNANNGRDSGMSAVWYQNPTSTHFSVGSNGACNADGQEFICYLFASGESNAATARSAYFDSSNINRLRLDDSADWVFGDTFTLEAWIKLDSIPSSGYQHICAQSSNYGFYCTVENANKRLQFYDYHSSTTINSANNALIEGQWIHVALVNNSGTAQWYINGLASGSSGSLDVDYDEASYFVVGGFASGSNPFGGYISNFRIVKGTAVYTSAFRPPTEPLTNITNTKLLCCQSSTVTAAAVSPGTITNLGNSGNLTTASTHSPFDDPGGFAFGESGSESVIKCGSYKGSSSADFEVTLGWEPQWIMFKRTDGSANWSLFDSMRGIVTEGNDNYLFPNLTNDEYGAERISLTPTGFKVDASAGVLVNQNDGDYIFVAVRRPDGYVGKPPELGTDVFAMDTGAGSSNIPNFDSGFPVDFQLLRQPASTHDWYAGARLLGNKFVETNDSAAESSANVDLWRFDDNKGWNSYDGYNSTYQSWMWKRHKGMDVVTYKGTGTTQHINHSLNKTVEMVWFKRRNATQNWGVYHKGLNSGSNPEDYYLMLNSDGAQTGGSSNTDKPLASAPTSTHIEVLGSSSFSNSNGSDYIAMLFASTDVSHVGYYSGDNSGQTITTGFQPRFIIIRNTAGYEWFVFDTVRGWSQNNQDWFLRLDGPYPQSDHVNDRPDDIGHPLSTGFYLKGDTNNDLAATNKTGHSYIYYAHA